MILWMSCDSLNASASANHDAVVLLTTLTGELTLSFEGEVYVFAAVTPHLRRYLNMTIRGRGTRRSHGSGRNQLQPSPMRDQIVLISVIILIGLFMVQRFGTDKVGYSFAPIICTWFLLIAGIGVYNFIVYDTSVIKALNPKYILDYFVRNKTDAWISLGGVVLCTTGAEALFADVGHFSARSVQLRMSCVTYPALILAYAGQASFLRKNNDLVCATFYKSIPAAMYWPMFVVAVLSAIIASQAMISGTFSIIQQSLSLGCFPRVQIVHMSENFQIISIVMETNNGSDSTVADIDDNPTIGGGVRDVYGEDRATDPQFVTPWNVSYASEYALLRDPHFNKGLAFTEKERDAHYLRGLLPPTAICQETQVKKMIQNIRQYLVPLLKYMAVMDLQVKKILYYFASSVFSLLATIVQV